MKTRTTNKTNKPTEKEQFQAAQDRWFKDHDDFVQWWKNHRFSGFCFKKDKLGREVYRWDIHPVVAWNSSRYKVEYHDTLGEIIPETKEFADFVRLQWKKDQKKVERLSERLGTTFDADHNQKVYNTLLEEYGGTRGFAFSGFANEHKDDPDVWPEKSEEEKPEKSEWTPESMKAKIDEAYSGPYLSEEEQEALRRRRPPEEQ